MKQHSILITEDEEIIAKDIGSRLKKLGYQVSGYAANSEDALEQARAKQPDLMLMDIRLGNGRDGIETVRRLRRDLDIPIVYLTSYCDEATVHRAMSTSPLGYLLKPFDQRELDVTLKVALNRHRDEQLAKLERQQFESILNEMLDGVVVIDVENQVRYVNPKAEHLTGFQLRDLFGRTLPQQFQLDGILKSDGFQKGGGPIAVNVRTAGGYDIPLELRYFPLHDQSVPTGFMVLLFRDLRYANAGNEVDRTDLQHYRQAIDKCGGAVWSLDVHPIVMNATNGWCQLMDIPFQASPAAQSPVWDGFVHEVEAKKFLKILMKNWDGKTPTLHAIHQIQTCINQIKWVYSCGKVHFDGNGKPRHLVGVTMELPNSDEDLLPGEPATSLGRWLMSTSSHSNG